MKITIIPEPVANPKTDRDLVFNIHCHNARAYRNLAKKNWHDAKVVARYNKMAEQEISLMKRLNPKLKLVKAAKGEQVQDGLIS